MRWLWGIGCLGVVTRGRPSPVTDPSCLRAAPSSAPTRPSRARPTSSASPWTSTCSPSLMLTCVVWAQAVGTRARAILQGGAPLPGRPPPPPSCGCAPLCSQASGNPTTNVQLSHNPDYTSFHVVREGGRVVQRQGARAWSAWSAAARALAAAAQQTSPPSPLSSICRSAASFSWSPSLRPPSPAPW